LSVELDMDDRQQSADGTETDRGISGFFVSARISKNKQWVIEDGHGLFKGDAMLALVLRGLRLVPFKGRTTVFEDPVHGRLEYHFVFTM
jgi:hypothetical protein